MKAIRIITALGSSAALSLAIGVSGAAWAQDEVQTDTFPSGGPEAGVDVPLRVGSPSDSRRLLAPESGGQESRGESRGEGSGATQGERTNPYRQALDRRPQAEGVEGEEGEGAPEARERRLPPAGYGAPPGMRSDRDRSPNVQYSGVRPGERDSVSHIPASGNEITWVGFQPEETRTRVFVQTGGEPRHEVIRGENEIRIRFASTNVSISNLRRDIDTRYFGRVVQSVRAERGPNGTADVVIRLARAQNFDIQREGRYLYIDFAENND